MQLAASQVQNDRSLQRAQGAESSLVASDKIAASLVRELRIEKVHKVDTATALELGQHARLTLVSWGFFFAFFLKKS